MCVFLCCCVPMRAGVYRVQKRINWIPCWCNERRLKATDPGCQKPNSDSLWEHCAIVYPKPSFQLLGGYILTLAMLHGSQHSLLSILYFLSSPPPTCPLTPGSYRVSISAILLCYEVSSIFSRAFSHRFCHGCDKLTPAPTSWDWNKWDHGS